VPSTSFMGATIRRREDPRLMTGRAEYVDDIQLARTAYLALLRSPHAHARIASLDASALDSNPHVLAYVTAKDIEAINWDKQDETGSEENDAEAEESGGGSRPLLADTTVRFVGEAVLALVADSKGAAEDALEEVLVDYEPLPAFVDMERSNPEAADFPGSSPGPDGVPVGTSRTFKAGDVDRAFAAADVVISQRMNNQRLAALPMEPRGVLSIYDPGRGDLTVYASTQCAHFVRDDLARLLEMPHTQVRVIAPEVGGGFGCKIGRYPEDILSAYFSRRLGRPIKWIESRSENFLVTVQGRSQVAYLELAATKEGRILGLKLRLLVDTGAADAGWLATTTSGMITGCYDIENVATTAYSVFTNKTPLGAYRGAGRPEAAYFIERGIDLLADQLGMNPADVRRTNFVQPDRFPFKTPDWPTFDSGDYQQTMEAAMGRADWDALIALRDEERAKGRLVGLGMASYVEVTGFGWETATLTIESDGSARVYTGISPHGQGQETTFAQIVADVCGIDPSDVRVAYGDTAMGTGRGTMGSRGTSVGGTALHRACVVLREKMRRLASEQLEVSPEDLELIDGAFRVRGYPSSHVTIKDLAKAANSGSDLPDDEQAGLVATESFSAEDVTAPFGTHIAMIEVDRETGAVDLLKLLTVDDCGTIVSPQLVEGQVHGGVMQGVAQALYEEVIHDEDGQLLTGSFANYGIPTIGETPPVEVTHTNTPSTRNELGIKGIGEAGSIGSTPAVINAVVDALSPLGIKHIDMPVTSARVWMAMHQATESLPA
jgi:carbon-monoxide dehydrogenase large subunit